MRERERDRELLMLLFRVDEEAESYLQTCTLVERRDLNKNMGPKKAPRWLSGLGCRCAMEAIRRGVHGNVSEVSHASFSVY